MNCTVSFEKFILPFGTVNPELSGDVLDDFKYDLDIEESKYQMENAIPKEAIHLGRLKQKWKAVWLSIFTMNTIFYRFLKAISIGQYFG